MGSAEAGGGFIIWVAKLVWEASFSHLEFNSFVFNGTVWRERNSRTFEDVSSLPDQLLGMFVTSLFDWSRIWGFTVATNVTEFTASWRSVPFHSNLL